MIGFRVAAALALAGCAVPAVAAPAAPATTPVTQVYFDNDFLGPGQSNIQALIPLLKDERVKVVGIGVVTGDAWLKEETQHLLRFLEIAKRTDIPVVEGAEVPLIRSLPEMKAWETRYGPIPWKGAWNAAKPGKSYHPDDPALVPPMREGAPHAKAADEDAAHFLIRTVRAHPGEITIVCAGPLTNIALAIRLAPDLPRLAKEIVIEGGKVDTAMARVTGNTDYGTDFNFLFDPEAAHIVLTSPWQKITLMGNVTGSVKVSAELVKEVASAGTPVAGYFRDYAKVGQPLWDEMTTAVAIDRSLVTRELPVRMDVDLMPGPDYGMAQVWNEEFAPHQGEQIVHLVQAIDADRFLKGFAAQAKK
jgi:inosine-uridine nucleoside N-ribohydrolase